MFFIYPCINPILSLSFPLFFLFLFVSPDFFLSFFLPINQSVNLRKNKNKNTKNKIMEVKTTSGRSGNCSSSSNSSSNTTIQSDQEVADMDLRRGPWTVEEDFKLINYIACHGEGRWNSLARCAGLKRTGKSCRLRWLNYLRPDVRRGNITLEEQLLILELHSRWGNRWSKIAQHLPGRTDNEIKNYWRTRVQKHAKQLKCDVNSKQFKDTMRYLWMPRLIERIQAANANANSSSASANIITSGFTTSTTMNSAVSNFDLDGAGNLIVPMNNIEKDFGYCSQNITTNYTRENSCTGASSDSFGTQVSPVSDLTEYYNVPVHNNPNPDYFQAAASQVGFSESSLINPTGYFNPEITDFQTVDPSNQLMDGGDASDNLWSVDDIWFLQQQFRTKM